MSHGDRTVRRQPIVVRTVEGVPSEALGARRRTISGWYVLGDSSTRFAVTRNTGRRWRLPWQRPRGGWWIGPFIVWWSR